MTETTSVTFRSAQPVDTSSAVSSPDSGTKEPSTQSAKSDTSDAPPSLYNELEKKPYAVKHLGLELYNDDDDFKDVSKQAKELDDYVLQQIKAQGLKDSAESYTEVINAIYKQIGKSANEDPTKSVKRLATAASAIARLESAKLPPVLSARSLSPTEFEEIQP